MASEKQRLEAELEEALGSLVDELRFVIAAVANAGSGVDLRGIRRP